MQITVRKGDTLWYYSQLFGLPFQLLLDSNRSLNVNSLQIGQSVNIPGFIASSYEIKQNDTLWKIAKSRNLLPDAVFLLNQDVNPQSLQIGQRIEVPSRVTAPIVQGNRQYDYSNMVADLNKLMDIYPFIKSRSIGKSVLGNQITELQLGRGSKKVHVNGSFHANEWITTNVLMTFLNDYLLALTNSAPLRGFYVYPLYFESVLSLVPMVNPDGVDLVLNGPPSQEPYRDSVKAINNGSTNFQDWKANIRGVDLNNQYPAKWDIEKERKEPKSPAPRDYPGDAPLTEPEAIAMANLTRQSNFSRVLAFHTQGEVIYWGYEGFEPPEAETIVNEFSRVSGYEAIRYVDSHAGYKDWFIQEWRRPGYTVELGEGVNPLPLSQFDEIYQESLGILLASLYM